MSGTPTYSSWQAMKRRCDNPESDSYPDYGGRGITYCDRWFSFENFLEDMGERPAGHTLDRIDFDSDYCPENCRWATQDVQARNRRSARLITHAGRTQCLAAWADEMGISPERISQRIARLGWSVADALTTPARPYRKGRTT